MTTIGGTRVVSEDLGAARAAVLEAYARAGAEGSR